MQLEKREEQNFVVYKASAGSGKTYTLTYNYIRLILQQPEYFKSILAVTFTNKATEEMKSRIISTLNELSQSDHSMSSDLKEELKISQVELQSRSENRLKMILHNYSFFAVTTIDAFFQKVVRSFAKEIGIHTGFDIELDQNKVLTEVINDLMMNLGKEPQLVKWLTSFAIHQINQGSSWDTNKQILSLSRELFKEEVVLNKEKIFARMDEPSFMKDFIGSVQNEIKTFEDAYQLLADKVVKICNQFGLSESSFSYGAAGVGGYIFKVWQGEVKEPGKRVVAAVEKDAWVSKSSNDKETVEQAVAAGLGDAVAGMIAHFEKHHAKYHTLKQAFGYLYTYGLLNRISQEVAKYKEENETLLISDFQIFLREIITDSDSPYIYEKIGSRYHHYLIDEFQDTSGVQWENFKPLIHDSLSSGNFNMVVGDVKQSIYRWRGGNWKILLNKIKEDIDPSYFFDTTLDVNRRSKRNIIEFNNELFSKLPAMLEEQLPNQEKLEISNAYSDSVQEYNDEKKEGCVHLDFYATKEVDDKEGQIVTFLINQIKSLQDANYALNDICILVRRNNEGRIVSEALMDHALSNPDDGYAYDVISNESLFLRKNKAIHLIFQVLHFVQNTEEPLYKRQLEQALANIDLAWDDVVSGWQNYALSHLINETIAHFELYSHQVHVPYLMAFQDAIEEFLRYGKDSVLAFKEWWTKNENRSIQASDNQDAMTLMTVHKSKGLQFKAVLMPFCDWNMDHGTIEQLLWCDTKTIAPLNAIPLLPMKYKTEMASTHFAESYYEEKHDIHFDNLNLLYVALTRAEEYLGLIAGVNLKAKNATTVGQLLLDYASQNGLMSKEDFDVTQEVIIGDVIKQETIAKEVVDVEIAAWMGNKIAPDAIQLRYNNKLLGEEQIESINYGDVVHWIFSQINVRNDFNRGIKSAKSKFGLDDDELDEIKKQLRQIWDMPGVSNWFSDQWEVKNESSILLTNGRMKRPDRVISQNDKAVVIDYKTGQKSSKHKEQVQEYKDLLVQMGYKEVIGYLIYFSEPEVVAV
ncbi:MAG: UvrD-helicase domain-containing protein [Reichenbachiella sp.]